MLANAIVVDIQDRSKKQYYIAILALSHFSKIFAYSCFAEGNAHIRALLKETILHEL
jgi:hypothetical protein